MRDEDKAGDLAVYRPSARPVKAHLRGAPQRQTEKCSQQWVAGRGTESRDSVGMVTGMHFPKEKS